MSLRRNDNPHRIYIGERPVRAGATFEATDAEIKGRIGISDATEADQEVTAEDLAPTSPAAVHSADLLSRGLSTARLRDQLDPETETTIKGTGEGRLNNQPSAGGPDEIVPREHEQDPNLPPPSEPEGAATVVTTGAPGHDEPASPRSTSAPAVVERLGDEPIAPEAAATAADSPAAASDPGGEVKFTSPTAANKADELRVSDSLTPGKGSGKRGAYTVADVEAAASS